MHDITIPHAELEAALLNASTGHIVRKSLKDQHKKGWKVTDSQVTLHWINCTRIALKMWVRNRVIEIIRLTEKSTWRYVNSENNIADLGTRKGATISDVGPNSPWIQGYPWMRGPEENFPLKTIDEVMLTNKQKSDANREKAIPDCDENSQCLLTRYVPSELKNRYKFSKYLLNPNRFRFRTVVRILGLVFFFIQKISKCLANRSFKFLKDNLLCHR